MASPTATHALTRFALFLPLACWGLPPVSATPLSASQDDLRREQDLSALEGRRPPALKVQGWQNTEAALDWNALRGKVVVLDFWGTW